MSKAKPKPVQYAAAKPDESTSLKPFAIGFVALDLAVIMTVLLVLEKLGSIDLPGCGPSSACALAQSSAWGHVPVGSLALPVSFLGLGYFAGMLAAWLIARGRLPSALRALAFIGAGISLLYMGVIFSQGHYCPYCIATHVANFIFVGALIRAPKGSSASLAPIAAAGAIMLGANIALLSAKSSGEAAQAQKQEGQLEASTKEIAQQGGNQATGNTAISGAASDSTDKPWKGPFTGRYRQGPEKAVYRIVLYTDYQCPDCFKVEQDIVQLMKTRNDISLSAKQFPFNKDCNPSMTQTLHGGACLAASMAEAAGLLRGNEGFWQMHHALFERQASTPKGLQGGFSTREEYVQFLMSLGYDEASFEQTRQDPRIMEWVRSDCNEAVALGLYYTPMVFINGVELKGIFAPQAVSRAIAALDASKLQAKGPEDDNPPLAAARHVSDWQEQPVNPMPVDNMTFGRGPANAKIKIAIIGDYQETGTQEALREISRLTAGRSDIRLDFRLFPFNRACNPRLPPPPQPPKPDISQFPQACVAARAAKAAGIVGGPDAFWKMHDWLVQNSNAVSEQSVAAAASSLGIDPTAFVAAFNGPDAQSAIANDANSLYGYLFKTGIPTIRVNDRIIPRWKLKGDNILERVFKEADKP